MRNNKYFGGAEVVGVEVRGADVSFFRGRSVFFWALGAEVVGAEVVGAEVSKHPTEYLMRAY